MRPKLATISSYVPPPGVLLRTNTLLILGFAMPAISSAKKAEKSLTL